ncbi:heat shock protein HslJ [Streptomyces griseochromogenes]|uniref:Heat shock protein HslJ n=1 Tax=Streptomyces griseochromogenes TaxID=68214 RepID=A0A1B1BBD5_9ACTN|nr:META domain-containing protein [Streptomyces griseochromogenes]ANP56042.1 META domain-containing protein [Streptomyces griseochromogenes]MBP2051106.1 heat shock protein HslJ [Streptomyces griseochromogenes]
MNRHKQHMILTAVAVLVPLTLACGSARSGETARPVTGVDWRVDGLTAADGTTRDAPAAAHLRIDTDGKAAGNLGCNQFGARATVHGDRITFGDLRTTRMACDQDRMDFERALARTLTTGTLTARSDDGKLTLTDGDGDRVDLSRHAPE